MKILIEILWNPTKILLVCFFWKGTFSQMFGQIQVSMRYEHVEGCKSAHAQSEHSALWLYIHVSHMRMQDNPSLSFKEHQRNSSRSRCPVNNYHVCLIGMTPCFWNHSADDMIDLLLSAKYPSFSKIKLHFFQYLSYVQVYLMLPSAKICPTEWIEEGLNIYTFSQTDLIQMTWLSLCHDS